MARPHRRLPPDPLWYKDAVIYQVHVKSFFDANNDGIGDLAGLIQKLDYIEELGANAIWMLPFYPSPLRDDGYDISCYRDVHPDYGTLKEMRSLVAQAHERGIRVIIELVINHTSDQHPWFQRARRARPGSAARNFYVWSKDGRGYADARIIFPDTEKSNWTFDPIAGAYYWHRFYAHQPDLNFDNEHVVEAVLAVMRFWLELGVDGFRLDAIPYLVEREGTNCENLPETHAILRRIRAELDARAPESILLAEANQWPEDVQEYFGDGHECHMAFHFPLMPRMYMAVAQEDRFPITDILRQTPDLPETCQWAIFLRNHDELTLEMVTSEERDYLWATYAADRRARLNLGIRRRLASLLEHDRQRIELLNGLLFSMPGTPVIYYGDEIGMGDNIHLRDRDGVRTPMQWSPDRNGGFSRADPASLVLPPIMDPIYGFAAVNVEAQAADRYSLLNWMRGMLATRRRHPAFGRGRLTFLYPGNRKILAFLREYEAADEDGEVILCVTNLAHTAQPVELDLTRFQGRVPVDLLGGSAFSPIGVAPYILTLPPHAFYWFALAKDTAMPAWRVPPSEPLPELVTLVLRAGIGEIVEGPLSKVIEGEILEPYLTRRHWSGVGDGEASIRIARMTPMIAGTKTFLWLDVLTESDGEGGRYVLPVGIVWDDEAGNELVKQLALARVRKHGRMGLLTDVFAIDDFARAAVACLDQARSAPSSDEQIRMVPTRERLAPPGPEARIQRLSAEESRTSLIIGEHAILTIFRRIEEGREAKVAMARALTERGFSGTPALLGALVRTAGGRRDTLMVIERFARNQGNGWEWTREALGRMIHAVTLTRKNAGEAADALAFYLPFASAIGRRLGELHATLTEPCRDPAFAPERVDGAMARRWGERVEDALDRVYAAARSHADGGGQDAALPPRVALGRLIPALAQAGVGTLRARIHGDFQLSHVLVTQGDATLIGFGSKPWPEGESKGSPLADVADMLHSFACVAASVAREPALAAHTDTRRRALLDLFVRTASDSFLAAYHRIASACDHPWFADRDAASRLIDLFLIRDAARAAVRDARENPAAFGARLEALAAIGRRVLVDAGGSVDA